VRDEVNVRELAASADVAAWAVVRAEPNWAALGKRLGKSMGAVAAAVKALSAEQIASYEASGSITVAGAQLGEGDLTVVRSFRAEHPEAVDCDAAGDGDVLVVLRLTVDASLAAAGLAREAASRVQRARKAAGVAAGAPVAVALASAGEATRAALAEHAAYLADALGAPPRLAPAEEAAAADDAPGHDGRPVLLRDRATLSNGEELVVVLSALTV
jgi:isoleucyl-tRNA synthetase